MSYDDDNEPLTIWDVREMSEEEINDNWAEVSKVLAAQDKPKRDDDDA